MKSKYLAHITNIYSTKNSLEKSIQQFLLLINRKLYIDFDVESIKKVITNQIENLNRNNKRCKPQSVHWHKSLGDKDWNLFMSGICAFSLLLVESELTNDHQN